MKRSLAAIGIVTALSSPAVADIINVTASGIVTSGVYGIGSLGGVLTGLQFTAHFTFDTSLNSQFFPGTQDLHGGTLQPGGYTSPATFADITINGFDTYALPSYSFFGQIIESPNSVDSYDARADGYNFILLDIKQCCGTAGLPGGIPGGLANSFIIDQPPNTTYEGSFAFYDPGALGHAAGQLAPNHIEVSVTPTVGVPGPAVGAGLPGLLAMLGLGGWHWRRRKKVA